MGSPWSVYCGWRRVVSGSAGRSPSGQRGSRRQPRDHLGRYGLGLEFVRVIGVVHDPDPGVAAFDGELAAFEDMMLDRKARLLDLDQGGLDLDLVAEPRR